MVAVKLLDETEQSEAQFVNEVQTIGLIHHNHLVRLLGFCFDKSRRALVYEFMANGSLDSTARGIAFLHDECRVRILHCDIKPHNILLDQRFTPKVSDFGLAQALNREISHASLTRGRGTPGYAPPEMWLMNHGPVTSKSDVYSYGMLVLEMVGKRRNFKEEASRVSEAYFPEWAYLHYVVEVGGEWSKHNSDQRREDEIVRTMALVGLWCIQFEPALRPTMRRVIEMLEGNVVIDAPPAPFDTSVSRVVTGDVSSLPCGRKFASFFRSWQLRAAGQVLTCDTAIHLFLLSDWAVAIWSHFAAIFSKNNLTANSIEDRMLQWWNVPALGD
ncbi:rust resistance kinase Lr10-like [Magnolia sinica]|uniref:rust resistance kinase Lr10-like n=1 Tax=Magnolia sinica TaxID=86752 RepID=UPI002658E31A|nr:rust resistance kinase Lr10-like [Magnolia sinica]